MKKKLLLYWRCCVVCLFSISFIRSSAQEGLGPLEIGFTGSAATYLGDLGGNPVKSLSSIRNNDLKMTRFMMGVHASVYPHEWLGVRLDLNYGKIAGDDAAIKGNSTVEENRRNRNLQFRSRIAESLLTAEIYPTVFSEGNAYDRFHKLRPYALAGVGLFRFRPLGKDPVTGGWLDLRSLHTEGQGFPEFPERRPYRLTQLNIPFGIGIKYFVDDNVSVGVELIHRKLFTDYLDDVSTRYISPDLFYRYLEPGTAVLAARMADKSLGISNRNPGDLRGRSAKKDAYYTAGIKLSIRIGDFFEEHKDFLKCPLNIY